MKIYNTLDRKKEEFTPIKKSWCKIYSCGPTVYSYAHIGNFRYFLFVDLLRRVLLANGYNLLHVMNITDVGHLVSDADTGEDKMAVSAKKENLTPMEIAKKYKQVFLSDMEKLNISMPEHIVNATDNIKDMEDYVLKIIDNGYTYQSDDTVYFDTSKLPNYGVLSKINKDMQMQGARVEDNNKKNPTDFALWIKAKDNHIMKWDSFFGKSYPGWHIECSAMSQKYLGDVFDIHTGGMDHISIHHENEIAQSIGNNGHNPAHYWMHSEFLQVDGGKMSKSLGNTYTILDLQKRGYHPLVFKYFTFQAHYRKKINFTFQAMDASKKALAKLVRVYNLNKQSDKSKKDLDKSQIEYIDNLVSKIKYDMQDDLNMPSAMGKVWNLVKVDTNQYIYEILKDLDNYFGLDLENLTEDQITNYKLENQDNNLEKPHQKEYTNIQNIPEQILTLASKRAEAKKNKDYALADELRTQIAQKGYEIVDTKEGYEIVLNEN